MRFTKCRRWRIGDTHNTFKSRFVVSKASHYSRKLNRFDGWTKASDCTLEATCSAVSLRIIIQALRPNITDKRKTGNFTWPSDPWIARLVVMVWRGRPIRKRSTNGQNWKDGSRVLKVVRKKATLPFRPFSQKLDAKIEESICDVSNRYSR